MTIQEMHYDFSLKVDEIENLRARSFNPAEKDWLLNEAQTVVIKNRLNINNHRRKGFEMDQKRIDDLKEIFVKFPEQPRVNLTYHEDSHIYELDLGSLRYTYWFFVRGNVLLQHNNCEYTPSLKIIQSDDFSDALNDPFNCSNEEEVLVNFGRASSSDNGAIYLYPSTNHTLTSILVEYIKKPIRMNLGGYTYIDGVEYPTTHCELSDHLHSEIVDQAVALALASMKDQFGFQAGINKIQTNE